jgi:hypothetical protein
MEPKNQRVKLKELAPESIINSILLNVFIHILNNNRENVYYMQRVDVRKLPRSKVKLIWVNRKKSWNPAIANQR